MTGMAEALAGHVLQGYGYDGLLRCPCGEWDSMTDNDSAYAAHVAQELANSGYGSMHDAWGMGWGTGWNDHSVAFDNPERLERKSYSPNPYPAGATS